MSLQINSALYYPTIEFQDYRWLWTASLIWDKIYRIQPDNFTPDEPDNIKILCEDGDIGIPLYPKEYAKNVADEFKNNILNSKWSAAALEKNQVKEYSKIHPDKVDVEIRNMLIEKGQAKSNDDWLYVPDDFAALYMTYFAKKIAQQNNLQVVSDKSAAWTALTYFSTGQIETESEPQEHPFALAALMIGNFVPNFNLDISPQKIVEFRRNYADERRNFMRAIRESAQLLANCHDAKVINDVVHTIQQDIKKGMDTYKESMSALKIETFTGFKTLSFPISTQILTRMFPQFNDTESIIYNAAGIAIGVIAGVSKLKQQGKKLSKDSDYSYLVHAEKEFPKTSDGINIPRSLHYKLNEFIND